MKAVTIDTSGTSARLALTEADAPQAGPRHAVVEVELFALNPGELRGLDSMSHGDRIGWDFVGTVSDAATDGSGPQPGTRVLGSLQNGAWAERVAADITSLAPVPDDVSSAAAACLPIPAMAAYAALRPGGALVGKRVLVTGAAGAVGGYACQLALRSGADVSALVRRDEQVKLVQGRGVGDVVVGENGDALGERMFDVIADPVAGKLTRSLVPHLSPGGSYMAVSPAGGPVMEIGFMDLFQSGGHVGAVNVFEDAARSGETKSDVLSRLLELVSGGELSVPVGDTHPVGELNPVVKAYLDADDRRKPVIHF